MEQEFEDIDSEGRWQNLYLEIRNQSHECAFKVAKYPENRNRNRYRDVSPCHEKHLWVTFWLMIETKAVIMLNRVIEKGSEKCAQYWPTQEEREMSFRDTRFVVTLVSEDVKSYYTTRVLELQNANTGETREIYHFHYTTWPDFGVPESPASFLNFLFKVRESGSLGTDHGPAVVHCSAGIGRSGTFSLVDTCLVLKQWRELSREDQEPLSESPPPPQPPKCTERYNGSKLSHLEDGMDPKTGKKTGLETPNKESDRDAGTNARKRPRDEKMSNPNQKTQKQTKPRITDPDKKRKRGVDMVFLDRYVAEILAQPQGMT
ncbi:hypothetical protein cypCar_00042233 [Cyprinus carpio]|nr:hypothetical protein cypCar_00042233 [Cyprinus carpio]